jgi:DNA-binding transcriptional ArsR family regulator
MESILDAEKLEEVASKLRAVAHPMRVAIIQILDENKQMNVTQIYKKLGIEQATASHHLNILKTKGVLGSRRDGKQTFYSIKQDSIIRIVDCVSRCKTS